MTPTIETIVNELPKIELSYETLIHKKVYDADFFMAIPTGTKSLAWFRKGQFFLLELDEQKKVQSIRENSVPSLNTFSLHDTLFYGTMFSSQVSSHFSVENILYAEGRNVQQFTLVHKFEIIKTIFETYEKNQIEEKMEKVNIHFGMPLMRQSFVQILQDTKQLPYKVSYIGYRYLYKSGSHPQYNVKYYNNQEKRQDERNTNINTITNKTKLFQIRATLQDDIYHLYENNKIYDVAYIPDFTTSVMMNQLFRNIKENRNLDLLEESDDEEEFENEKPDKFVDLNKTKTMLCHFHPKFRKWVPVETK